MLPGPWLGLKDRERRVSCVAFETMSTLTTTIAFPERDAIRDHYDRLSPLYRTFWGDHIHHGYWEDDQTLTASEAQEALIRRLAARAAIARGARVLDVGTGLGGSALWLARELDCTVDGITLSPVQVEMATERARSLGLDRQTRFWVHDAHDLATFDRHYDVVWTVECSEHLSDRAVFFAAAAQRLRPGGVLALCSWLRGDSQCEHGEHLHRRVCQGMLCPPLATSDELVRCLQAAGFDEIDAEDITPRVAPTWVRCAATVRRPEVRAILAVSDQRTRRFISAFPAMLQAYSEGAMRYGMFIARRSAEVAGGPSPPA